MKRWSGETKSQKIFCSVCAKDWYRQHFLDENCPRPQLNATRTYWWFVYISVGHGLVPSGNKPLSEPVQSFKIIFFLLDLWDWGTHRPCHVHLIVIAFNTLRARQDGRHFPEDILKWIFLNENLWISLKISLKFVPKVQIDNIPALVQIMAWRCSGDKPLSEPMMVSLPTHICVTRPQWVKFNTLCPVGFYIQWCGTELIGTHTLKA